MNQKLCLFTVQINIKIITKNEYSLDCPSQNYTLQFVKDIIYMSNFKKSTQAGEDDLNNSKV